MKVFKSLRVISLFNKVFNILRNNPITRYNDKILVMEIWSRESNSKNIYGFFNELINGEVSHFESIRRMRQKIQKKYPGLRGEVWNERHKQKKRKA